MTIGSFRKNRQIFLIMGVVVVVICLLGFLIYRIFTSGGTETAKATPPPPPPPQETPAELLLPEGTASPAAAGGTAPTPLPTPVVPVEQPPATASLPPEPGTAITETVPPTLTVEPAATETLPPPPPPPTETPPPPPPTATETPPPLPQPTVGKTGDDDRISPDASSISAATPTPEPPRLGEVLKNGGFEEGFTADQIGLHWGAFSNERATIVFGREVDPLYIKDGVNAQRINIIQPTGTDSYAGIYQQVEVIPGERYVLTLKGLIRTTPGDIRASNHGYRVQYALDYEGGISWSKIPADKWIELPWDEQPLYYTQPRFLTYATEVTATSGKMTLFIRAWNKWPSERDHGEYTFDSLSLVGLVPPPPPTPEPEELSLMGDGRFWGGSLTLVLLAFGAVFRARWGYK